MNIQQEHAAAESTSTATPGGSSSDTSNEIHYPVEFRGDGGEYFKIWIVNILLTIVTLYIYSAWAKVRTQRYFYGNTVVDNTSFEYHAQPRQILTGRIVAVVGLIAVTFGGFLHPAVSIVSYVLFFLLFPWVLWRSIRFNARMTSYRNVRFTFNNGAAGLYKYLMLWGLIPLLAAAAFAGWGYYEGNDNEELLTMALTAGFVVGALMYPLIHRLMSYYALNGYQYGTAKFSAKLGTAKFYLVYFLTILFYVLIFVLVALFFALLAHLFGAIDLFEFVGDNDNFDSDSVNGVVIGGLGVLAYFVILLTSFLPVAYWRATLRNYRLNNVNVADRVRVVSTVKTLPLWGLMLTNSLLVGASIGLAYPWTRIRILEFFSKNTKIVSQGELNGFVAAEEEAVSALGEEIGDAFDMDMDIGL